MLALAWKEYRQIRLVAALLLVTLLAAYVISWASPWAQYRGGVIFIGPMVIISLIGVLAFAQERRERTDRFLTALPLSALRRWTGKALANLAFAFASVALLLLAIWLIDASSRSHLFNEMPFPYLPWSLLGLGVLLPLWAVSLFYSALFEKPISALVCTWATLIVGFALPVRLFKYGIAGLLGRRGPAVTSLSLALLATPTLVFLVGSLVVEARRKPSLSFASKALALFAAPALTLAATVLILTAGIIRDWEVTNRSRSSQDGAAIWQIGALPRGDGLLVLRDDRRLLETDLAGDWRLYDAGNVQLPWWRQPPWLPSPDGEVLPYFENDRKSFAETSVRVVRLWWEGGGGMLDMEKFLPRLLNLNTNEVIVPDIPGASNVLTTFLGWHGAPPRLFALVDRYERGIDAFSTASSIGLLESRICVLSEQGDLVETRDVPEMTAFRQKVLVPMPEGGSAWRPVDAPVAAGNHIVIPYRIHRTDLSRQRGDALRPTMAYDLRTGACRERTTRDPNRHVAFSPDLEWEILVDRPVPPEWDVHNYYSYDTSRGSLSFSSESGQWSIHAPSPRKDTPAAPPPTLTLDRTDGASIDMCSFPPGLKSAEVDFSFLRDNTILFALVTENAAEPTPGFDTVALQRPSGEPIQLSANRRVRAFAVDLAAGALKQKILPPALSDFIAHPDEPQVICHSAVYDRYATSEQWLNWDCLILSLPDLSPIATYSWPEGTGPTFSPRGWQTAFLPPDRLASVTSIMQPDPTLAASTSRSVISVWTIGPDPPGIVELPNPQGDNPRER